MICVLGDAHLDVVVCPDGPIAEETDTPARTWVGGGQAANVAAWICALGGQARLIAARGSDLAAGLVAADLARRGVSITGPVMDGATGVVVSLSDRGASRSMLTDRGVGPLLAADALADDWFTGCCRLHLPAYSLASEPIRGAALAAAAARATAQRRPVVHGRAARSRRRPVPGPARRTAAGDRVRHRGGGGAHRGSAGIRPGGEARPARCARRGRGPPGAARPRRGLDRRRATRSRRATCSEGSAWAWPRRPGRWRRWERCHDDHRRG